MTVKLSVKKDSEEYKYPTSPSIMIVLSDSFRQQRDWQYSEDLQSKHQPRAAQDWIVNVHAQKRR